MELIGRTLGQYRVIEQIGSGGMATVYKAYQPGLDRFVALKVLPPVHSKTPGFQERFLGDARAVAQLSHPNILPVYDVGVEEGISYFVMKYVPGKTLKECVGKPLSFPFILRCMGQIAAALDHAHKRGIIHRDVKPANILVEDEWLYLTDFGVAKIMEASMALTCTGEILGTPFYMSPEQASGKEVDHRTDIYSLGVVLFEMTTGTVPFKGETPMGVLYRHVHDPLPIPRSLRADIPESVEMVILKAMSKNPPDRFESAGDMAQALRIALTRDLENIDGAIADACAADSGKTKHVRTQRGIEPWQHAGPELPTGGSSAKSRGIYGSIATLLALIAVITAFTYYGEILSWLRNASVQISSNPPGASVFADGKLAGKTPLPLRLAPGEHMLRVELPEYEPWEYRAQLDKKGSYPFFIDLKPIIKLASLRVESAPLGAQVYVDGNLKGVTPMVIEVPFGRYSIRMMKPDYDIWEEVVQLDKPGEYPLRAELKEVPKLAFLEVDSNPSGAEVKVDGVMKGKTPTQQLELPVGEYKVELRLSGYKPREERVSLKEAKAYNVMAYMEPLKAPQAAQVEQKQPQAEPRVEAGKTLFRIDSTPGASLLVDEKYVGDTPSELHLPPGTKHGLKLKLFGYEVWEDSIGVVGNKAQTLAVTLIPQKRPSDIIIDVLDTDPNTIVQARLVETHQLDFITTFTVLDGDSNKGIIARLNWTVLAGNKEVFSIRHDEVTCRAGRPCTRKYSHVLNEWKFGDYKLRVEVEVGGKKAVKDTSFRVIDKYASE